MVESAPVRPQGLLAIFVDVPGDLQRDFDDWYDSDHPPVRGRLPGFLSAVRYRAVQGEPNNMALYELASLDALQTPEYLELRRSPDPSPWAHVRSGWKGHTRIIYRLRNVQGAMRSDRLDAPYLAAVRLFVRPGGEDEVREWLDGEHAVRQLTVPGARFYHGHESVEGPSHFLTLWGLEDPAVFASAQWEAVRDTPWRKRVSPLMERTVRGIYKRI